MKHLCNYVLNKKDICEKCRRRHKTVSNDPGGTYC